MQIKEVGQRTNLTKKAIEYYTRKGMITPSLQENGYRDYSEKDVECLMRISILRKLGVGVEEIKEIQQDDTREAIQRVTAKRELRTRRNALKDSLLRELSCGKPYSEVEMRLQALEMEKTIGEKLLEAFPGYFGRFVSAHFSRFLNEPIQTEKQQEAYEKVLCFLDHMPNLEIPEEIEKSMSEATMEIGVTQIEEMFESVKRSIEEPEEFLMENQEAIEWYLSYKQSEEYKNSAAGKWMKFMKEFQNTSGYTNVFLPAMKELSPSYASYCRQMEQAEKKLLAQYPEIEKIN